MKSYTYFYNIATILSIIGAINWGIVGIFQVNLVQILFSNETIVRLVYGIVGLCGIITAIFKLNNLTLSSNVNIDK